jgi:cell division inhibitor SulA
MQAVLATITLLGLSPATVVAAAAAALVLLLLQDPLFRKYTAARWQQLRAPGGSLTDEWFVGQIAGLKQVLQEPAARNYQR